MEAIRERLKRADAPQFWRGLEELADTEEFRQYIEDEFPNRADLMKTMDRRQFMILAGASPLLAKESERVYETTMKIVRWRPKRKPRTEEAAEQEQE